jgi:hypothetical protein
MGKKIQLGTYELTKGLHELNFDANQLAIRPGLYNLSVKNGRYNYILKLIIKE